MKRQIINIDDEKCIGCGLCAGACEQGAIQIIDGKAKLISDSYCDGLGMCLPSCPVDAIKLTEADAVPFDQTRKGITKKDNEPASACGCPGNEQKSFSRPPTQLSAVSSTVSACGCSDDDHKSVSKPLTSFNTIKNSEPQNVSSQLQQWPVQISLISTQAPYLEGANLLIAADCCAFAYGNFHNEFIKGKVTMIGCPKLDNVEPYIEKLATIFATRNIASITVTRMSVPCCGGITSLVRQAIKKANKPIPYVEVTITTDGQIQL